MDMNAILEDFKNGKIDKEKAVEMLESKGFSDLGYAKVDFARKKRVGYPEVIFCEGKELPHLKGIVGEMLKKGEKNILATRASVEAYNAILEVDKSAKYYDLARIVTINPHPVKDVGKGKIAVLTAGTADIKVAEEAAITAEMFGNSVERFYDVGVAGIHRLFAHIEKIREANVVICVAGMEGALASVVAGLVDRPVIALPTSVGYGASMAGFSALLTMINSCAAGIGVVNIDNGFGAGYLASSINRGEE